MYVKHFETVFIGSTFINFTHGSCYGEALNSSGHVVMDGSRIVGEKEREMDSIVLIKSNYDRMTDNIISGRGHNSGFVPLKRSGY